MDSWARSKISKLTYHCPVKDEEGSGGSRCGSRGTAKCGWFLSRETTDNWRCETEKKGLHPNLTLSQDDVIKWKHFPRHWPFVWGVHRSPVNSPHKGQWRGALMFSLISVRINSWENNGETGDLRRHRGHYDVIVMFPCILGLVSI